MYDPLTKENGIGAGELKVCFDCSPGPDNEECGLCDHFERAIQRLFEYERSGLSPEEVAEKGRRKAEAR